MHPDPDLLALLALGERVDTHVSEHTAGCARCRSEVADLAHIVSAARSEMPVLQDPPAQVWQRIAGELDFDRPAGAGNDAEVERSPERVSSRTADELGLPAYGPSASEREVRDAAVVGGRGRTLRRVLQGVAAAAVALVMIGVGFAAGRMSVRPPDATTVATAVLVAQPTWTGAVGAAEVRRAPDGSRRLWVRLETPTPVDGRREVWLAKPDLSGLQSLGNLVGGEGELNIPDGLDLTDFTVVDVSREPVDDSDPAHSTDSIVRGPLQT